MSFSKFCFFTANLGCGGSTGVAGAASFSSLSGFLSFSCLLLTSAAASPASFTGSLTSCGTFFVSSVVAVVMSLPCSSVCSVGGACCEWPCRVCMDWGGGGKRTHAMDYGWRRRRIYIYTPIKIVQKTTRF